MRSRNTNDAFRTRTEAFRPCCSEESFSFQDLSESSTSSTSSESSASSSGAEDCTENGHQCERHRDVKTAPPKNEISTLPPPHEKVSSRPFIN